MMQTAQQQPPSDPALANLSALLELNQQPAELLSHLQLIRQALTSNDAATVLAALRLTAQLKDDRQVAYPDWLSQP